MNARFKHGYAAEFDQAELAVRMVEAGIGLSRPPGTSAIAALEGLEPEVRALWLRAAEAALLYFEHEINNASPIQ